MVTSQVRGSYPYIAGVLPVCLNSLLQQCHLLHFLLAYGEKHNNY